MNEATGEIVDLDPATRRVLMRTTPMLRELTAREPAEIAGLSSAAQDRHANERAGEMVDRVLNPDPPERMIPLRCHPKANCKKCFGRGWKGKHPDGRHIACDCCRA